MKKTLAILMVLTLIISAIVLPAMAENTTADQVTSATTQIARGGRGQMPGLNNRMPQMPRQNGQNGQLPQMPDQGGQNAQPQVPDRNNSQGQLMPGKAGRKGFRSENNTFRTDRLEQWLAQLVTDGVITQEVSDAILAHMKEQITQSQAGSAAPAENTVASAQPEAAAPEGSPEEKLLKEMLDSGVITQEQYDQYAARISVPEVPEMPEAPQTEAAGT